MSAGIYGGQRKKMKIIVALVLLLIIIAGVVAYLFLTRNNKIGGISVTVDPMIVYNNETGSGFNHLQDSATNFSFKGTSDSSTQTSNPVNVSIQNGEYVQYQYTFANTGSTAAAYSIELTMFDTENWVVKYQVNNNELKNIESSSIVGQIEKGKVEVVWIKLMVDNPAISTTASGKLSLTVQIL